MTRIHVAPTAALLLALGLSLALPSGAAWAQTAPAPAAPAADAATPAPGAGGAATGFNPGQEVGADNGAAADSKDYILETDGDWEVRCISTPDGFDPCQLYQLLHDEKGNSVAEFSMVALPDGSEAAAGATIITPLETLLTAQLTMVVDGGKAKRYPFTWCSQVGCFSRIGFTAAEIAQLKKGNKVVVTIVPMLAPDQKVNVTISLAGFTAGFERMKTQNAETQARANEAAKAAKPDGGATPPASAN